MRKQWRISQQDNYANHTNCVTEFLFNLYSNFNDDMFMYIIHDKEADRHIHVNLLLRKATTKKELLKFFPFADIRTMDASNLKNYEYLTHKNDDTKTQYSESDIQFHNIDTNQLNEWLSASNETPNKYVESEILDCIVNDILLGVYTDFIDILRAYKGVALKYSRSIKETLENVKNY